MSRTQTFNGISVTTMTVAGTKYQLTSTAQLYKSAVVQSDPANTGVISIFDPAGGLLYKLAVGQVATMLCDNMDNGTAGKFDLSTVFASSSVAGDKVILSATEGL